MKLLSFFILLLYHSKAHQYLIPGIVTDCGDKATLTELLLWVLPQVFMELKHILVSPWPLFTASILILHRLIITLSHRSSLSQNKGQFTHQMGGEICWHVLQILGQIPDTEVIIRSIQSSSWHWTHKSYSKKWIYIGSIAALGYMTYYYTTCYIAGIRAGRWTRGCLAAPSKNHSYDLHD